MGNGLLKCLLKINKVVFRLPLQITRSAAGSQLGLAAEAVWKTAGILFRAKRHPFLKASMRSGRDKRAKCVRSVERHCHSHRQLDMLIYVSREALENYSQSLAPPPQLAGRTANFSALSPAKRAIEVTHLVR